jgi:ABC-type amino acid transport substrate-binding protein
VKIKKFSLAAIFSLLLCSYQASAKEQIKLAIGFDESTVIFQKTERVLAEVSKLIDKEVLLKHYPAHRSRVVLREGVIHGDLIRLKNYQTEVPSAILINIPLIESPFYVYSSKSIEIDITNWDSVLPYTIVTVRGLYWPKVYLRGHKVHEVSTQIAAFKFLKAKRADLFIENYLSASSIIDSKVIDIQGITKLEPAIDHLKAYLFISGKYPLVAKEFFQALKHLKESGKLVELMWN